MEEVTARFELRAFHCSKLAARSSEPLYFCILTFYF